MSAVWLRREAEGSYILHLHVQPGAKRTGIAGLHGGALKIRLAAPPVEGKANAALTAFLAEELNVTRAQVDIIGGDTSRQKRLRISGVADEAIAAFTDKYSVS
ncbi:MAG: DUF167 domain-containing protein [Zoogloeaceae bacterium]|jgi:uncharacterized protein (TIGR00251 family)|nr:DUF167 domain-containing protein [Zoogloeaceae bacterium]